MSRRCLFAHPRLLYPPDGTNNYLELLSMDTDCEKNLSNIEATGQRIIKGYGRIQYGVQLFIYLKCDTQRESNRHRYNTVVLHVGSNLPWNILDFLEFSGQHLSTNHFFLLLLRCAGRFDWTAPNERNII